jgi:hypothetical protein
MSQIHYEVFMRRGPNAAWALEMATENRAQAVETAEDILSSNRAIAVRVTKEQMDPSTGEFTSVTILNKGAPDTRKIKAQPMEDPEPVCSSPQDLYSVHAREKIGRLLEDWLRRYRSTPFELLHSVVLVERLEASGTEMQHAIQKVAIPESQHTGQPVHEILRAFQKLVERACERVVLDSRKRVFPDLKKQSFADALMANLGEPERAYRIGGAVAAHLEDAKSWSEKVDRLLDLAEQAPSDPQARALAFYVLEQPLSEILGSKVGLADVLGGDLDLGASLAALVRLAAPKEVEALIAFEAGVARLIPPLTGPAERLGRWLEGGEFKSIGATIAKRVLTELMGPRRLRPSDPAGEIAILRALAMALTASAGRIASLEDVQEAFVERSKTLVAADFVGVYLADCQTGLEEVDALVELVENVAGAGNKRAAAQWLAACVGALRFEKEIRARPEPASAKLQQLASLQKTIRHAGLMERDRDQITDKIGQVGALVEADTRLCAQLVRAPVPLQQKLTLLLRMASGETAPFGPASDRAKAEALRLLRTPEVRAQLTASPASFATIRPLVQAAGLAA